MSISYVRNIISAGYNIAKINQNFENIETALLNAVSRAGTAPNQMNADFDMNSHDIMNARTINTETLRVGGVDIETSVALRSDVYASNAIAAAATIPVGVSGIRTNGKVTEGDTLGGLYIDSPNGSTDTFVSSGGTARTWYRVTDVGVPRLAAEVAVRLIEFDARDSRFAGGVRWDDSTDDTAAIQAAITYFQTLGGLNQYEGQNAAVLRLPRGVGRVSNLDLTLAKNVTIQGLSDGATTLRNINNNTCIKTTNVAGTNDNYRLRLKDFTIIGPGRSNVNAHGIDFFAVNNGEISNVRVYACRGGMRFINNWQTNVVRPMLDGGPVVGGGLTCYDGIVLLDGPGSVVENGVKLIGGVVSGAERYGFRGESVSGSLIMGLELLACGSTAMYIGDSPSGKDLKWFSVIGCMFDSSGDLIVVNKGGSAVGTQMHWSGLWMGNANAGSGQGDAIRLNDLTHCTFQADLISNVDNAFVANSCSNVTLEYRELNDYDRSSVGAVPIQLANCSRVKVLGGPTNKLAGSPSTLNLAETSGTDHSHIDISHGDGGMTIIGANTIVRGNRTFKTRNSGLANVLTGNTSVVVTHGLGRTPTDGDFIVIPKFNIASVGVTTFWVDTITATTFTIHTNAAPSSNLGFHWQGDVSRG